MNTQEKDQATQAGYELASTDLMTMTVEECQAKLEAMDNSTEFTTLDQNKMYVMIGYYNRLQEQTK